MKLTEQLSTIFRQIESDKGTSVLSEMVLNGIVESFDAFEAKSVDDFYDQFRHLLLTFKTTKPRIGILIFHMCEIWEELQDKKKQIKNLDELKEVLTKAVESLINDGRKEKTSLISHGLECIEDGDSILIHSHSGTVMQLMEDAHNAKKKLRVVLAEQEEEKTEDMIWFLQTRRIPFIVVPEYMLSHVETEVNKVFLGAITFNNQYTFITDAGTTSVVSEFHHAKVPIYMFLTEKKFSLWDATKKHQTYKVTQKRTDFHPEKVVTYERIKFSHDRVPVDLVDFVVTENGIFSPDKIQKQFDEKYKCYANWRTKYFGER